MTDCAIEGLIAAVTEDERTLWLSSPDVALFGGAIKEIASSLGYVDDAGRLNVLAGYMQMLYAIGYRDGRETGRLEAQLGGDDD